MNHNLHYPNLEHCDVEPTSGTVNKNPPPSASLSDKILEQMTAPLPVLYDFRIGTFGLGSYLIRAFLVFVDCRWF